MIRVARNLRRWLVLSVVVVFLFMVIHHSSNLDPAAKAPIRQDILVDEHSGSTQESPILDESEEIQQVPKVKQQQDAVPPEEDDTIYAEGLPPLTPEHIAQAEDEREDQELMENSPLARNDRKHSQGFVKHVDSESDILSDPGEARKPLLYNRVRTGKISAAFTDNDDVFEVPIEYTFKNPLQKMRDIPAHKNVKFPLIQQVKSGPDDGKCATIKNLFAENWKQFFYFAKKYDSFRPLTLSGENDYLGWCVTLIDSLDTLFIMGFKYEFEMAVSVIDDINFFSVDRDDIPIFEANIRVLGGLLGAYDISKDDRLLEKAKDVAYILIRAFDTVNQMPLAYYSLKPSQIDRLKFASMTNYLSEIGSLSLEFTRLSIITGDMSYYTYVMNLLDTLMDSAGQYLISGLIPNEVDLSGCEKILRPDEISSLKGGLPKDAREVILAYDLDDDNEIAYCIPFQGKTHIKSPNENQQVFSLEGKSDSFYEYLLKLYQLLNGDVEDKYVEFYKTARDKIKKFLVFHPNLPDPEAIFLNEVTVTKIVDPESGAEQLQLTQHNQVSHLSCFAGGFFALSGRVFLDHSDLLLGKQLTRSCYMVASQLGVFPESFMAESCDDVIDCKYNEQQRIKYIDKHTSKDPVEGYEPLKKSERFVYDFDTKYLLKTSTKIPYSPYDSATKKWKTGEAANQPLEFNDMDPRHLLRPELIESLFVNFRITGDPIYREEAWELFNNLLEMSNADIRRGEESETVQASIKDITDKSSSPQLLNEQESWWFAETLKYYYLIFQDSKVLSLDEWVFNTEGHPFRKEKFWLKKGGSK